GGSGGRGGRGRFGGGRRRGGGFRSPRTGRFGRRLRDRLGRPAAGRVNGCLRLRGDFGGSRFGPGGRCRFGGGWRQRLQFQLCRRRGRSWRHDRCRRNQAQLHTVGGQRFPLGQAVAPHQGVVVGVSFPEQAGQFGGLHGALLLPVAIG